MTENDGLPLDLFGEPDIPGTAADPGVLAREFTEPPFTTLDTRTGRWRARAAQWRRIGIQSEIGRDDGLLGQGDLLRIPARPTGTSIFDPVVTELAYRWYSAPGDLIFDPFAGGSVRGVIASCLARRYVGIDIRSEQVEANREQARSIMAGTTNPPQWVTGDAATAEQDHPDLEPDLIFTCPPYFDLERYSDHEQGPVRHAPRRSPRTGKPRLSPRFVEWMMGLPDGWVTDVPDLTRGQQLRALGNGVVPAQAYAALQWMGGGPGGRDT